MRSFITAAIVTMVFTGPSLASDNLCGNEPHDKWMTKEALKLKATEMGYDVRRIKVDDGCYEAYAIDQQGKKVEIYFHPVTAEVVKTKVED